MVKKFLLGTTCAAALLMGSVAFSNPSSTGFYAGIRLGGAYNKVKESFRHSSQKKDTQVDIIEVSRNGVSGGAVIGYGYELSCGIYVGANMSAAYDFTKIDGDKGTGTFKKTILQKDGTPVPIDNGAYKVDIRPMVTYGFAVQVGGKIMPNVLAYASFGVEGTYTKIKQVITGGFNFVVQNEMGNGDVVTESDGTTSAQLTLSTNGTEEAKIHLLSLTPGVGAKWFANRNVYVGVQCDFPIGLNKKLDEKYYTQNLATATTTQISSVSALGNSIYVKRPLGVRYALTVGCKF
ncbi:MAG: hypothetical protein LBF84_00035 [Holosporales bacterium]|jgi:hypothetical protein|nr:hypothetical protein [Holosporales bacterium]